MIVRQGQHPWLLASLFACSLFHLLSRRPFTRSVVHWLVISVTRSLGRSFARSLGRPILPFAQPLGRSFVRSLGRARVRHLALFLPRSIVRSFACLRTLARSLAGLVPRALIRFRTDVLARARAIVRSCSVARPLVRSFARSLVRSALAIAVGAYSYRGAHSEECILKETAAQSPVKLLI